MNKNSLSNASNKRRSNHNPTQSSSTSLSKAPVLGRNDSKTIMSNNHHEDATNIETTTNIETSSSTIDTNNYSVSCICGKPLIRVTLSESYSDEPSVCCNMCFMIYRNPKDVIYICELRKTTQFHNNGYGFCQSCASKLSQEESLHSAMHLNRITTHHPTTTPPQRGADHHVSGAELIKNRLNGTISMLECDGNKHEFLPFMDRMSWFERVGLEYLAKQHMTDDEMKEMKDKLQGIKDKVIEKAFDLLKSKIVEIDTMVTRLQEIQIRGNTKLLKEYNIKIRIHRRQLLRIQNESSGKYRNQQELLNKLSKMRHCINEKTSEQIASCVCGEELFAMSVQECNYSDSWWCSHCCETYYKHDMLYHCENGKKCIYNELMQYIYDLCQNCWSRLKINHATDAKEELCCNAVMIPHDDGDSGVDPAHLMIRKRLWESLQILKNCITCAHQNDCNEDSLEVMDKLAKRICNFETQFVKLKTCLEDEEREKCSFKMQELVNILKEHLSLCLCGDIMIKLKATNYYCAHCFQTFKGKERVITFCRRRDKCKFYQNGYRLCEHCSNDLMKEKILNNDNNDNNNGDNNGDEEEYIIGQYASHTTKSNANANVDDQKQCDMVSNTNNNTTSNANHNIHGNINNNNNNNNNNSEPKEAKEEKKNINWTVCCRIEQRLQQSICILEKSATDDMTKCNKTLRPRATADEDAKGDGCKDKTQWNEHWNDWISRCNQFSSCLNKTKEHLHTVQFKQITDNFEIVKRRAVQRTLTQTNESITEISNALHSVKRIESNADRIGKYRQLNTNVTEFRRQLLKMKRHGQDVDIDNQLQRLGLIRDGIHKETGDRMTTCICGEQLFRRKASECYGNNYWCNRCFKTYSKDTYLFHCEVHKECEYHQFGYDLCEECAMVLRNDENVYVNNNESDPDHIKRIVHRLRASLGILENDVLNNEDKEHKDDMAKRVDNFEMQYDPLIKWLSPRYNDEIGYKLRSICDLIKPFLPLCLCGSWFKHGSCDNAFICRCCSKSYEKGVETYYCKNTENCLYWKHGYNLCETCALTYKDEKHKKERLTDRIIHRLWNSIHHIESGYNTLVGRRRQDSGVVTDSWDSLVLRYDNCEQYIQKCTYTHWLYNILSTNACLDNTQSYLMKQRLNKLGDLFKSYVPVCFCGDVFIYVQSPYELDCKHCFKELKENDKTYFCKSRDDCQHWNNSYYLCEDCVKELRKKHNKYKPESADQRIKSRLNRSVQILREYVGELKHKELQQKQVEIEEGDEDGKRWLKMAYKVDQCKQHSDKLKVKLEDSEEWCHTFDAQFETLINEVKIRVPLCLCGAFFVHETSPIDFRCRHCFKLYDADGVVIHYCQQQRECQHFNSDYYLCNDCAMSLRKSQINESIKHRAYKRLMNSIRIIANAVDSAVRMKSMMNGIKETSGANGDEWKDVSVRVYFYEQQLERLTPHLETEERAQLKDKLEQTLLQMKQHLATCLCGNLFVSGPSPIDYECRSCFHECRVEENIYVCKSKQKCEHWRNHYYICDHCSILLRKCNKFESEELRIVDRLQGAIQFITDEFNQSIQLQLNTGEPDATGGGDRGKQLEIFNKYLHKSNSFEQNFLSQIKSHITPLQLEETRASYKALKAYVLKVSANFIDERYRSKYECEILIFGFIRELYLSLEINMETQIFNAVPEYVFHVCLDYYFQIHPQIFVLSMAKGLFRSLPFKFDNIEIMDLNDGISSNLSFYDMKSFNKSFHSHSLKVNHNHKRSSSYSSSCALDRELLSIEDTVTPQQRARVCNITNNIASNKTVVKHKSWNKKECAFCVAINISIPSFITSIKPSLFDENHHYDVLFKCGGETPDTTNTPQSQSQSQSQTNKEYCNEASALIIDSSHFNHHYSDHYAFKSRHFRLQSHLKRSKHPHHKCNLYYKRQQNGYSLSLPPLPETRRCQVLFDYQGAQLLAYCDNKFDIYSLPFNDSLKSENEWKWDTFKSKMTWSRARPSLSIMNSHHNHHQLFIVGDIQNHHAKYAELYSFDTQEWAQLPPVPYTAHNGCLYNDAVHNRMFYIGGQQRHCGYYDAGKDEWCTLPSTEYIYSNRTSVIWNSLETDSQQIVWIANATNCEFLDCREDTQKWQTFPNLDNNNTHLKLQNLLNIRFDSTNCDYMLLCRI